MRLNPSVWRQTVRCAAADTCTQNSWHHVSADDTLTPGKEFACCTEAFLDDAAHRQNRRLPEDSPLFGETWQNAFPTVKDGKTCPILWMLDRIGERWSLWVLCYLADHGVSRFSDIASNLGEPISNRMLSLTLDKLEQNVLVARHENEGAVTYELTDLGTSLMTPMRSLVDWVIVNAATLDNGRRKFGLPPLDLPAGVLPKAD